MLNFTEQQAVLGRVPGYSRSDIKLLSSSVSKRAMWKVYIPDSSDERRATPSELGRYICVHVVIVMLLALLIESQQNIEEEDVVVGI